MEGSRGTILLVSDKGAGVIDARELGESPSPEECWVGAIICGIPLDLLWRVRGISVCL